MTQEEILWQRVLGEIEVSVSRPTFTTFFMPTKIEEMFDHTVRIGVQNIFSKNQFEARYKNLVKEVLQKNGVDDPVVEFVISHTSDKKKKLENEVVARGAEVISGKKNDSGLNPRYRFDNFIVGTSNDIAHAAAQAAASMPGQKYNPIFVYGGVGLGKTHLIQAIGNEILARDSKKKVMYVPTDKFVNEFIDFVRYKKDRDFSKRYRDVDVLIIDDIQFIAGKEKNQEEFFHIFNSLHQADKQIVISSDRPPASIPTLTDRLRSRFQMGMAIDIHMPDFETRCAIIEAKAADSSVEIPRETTEYLAENIKTNIRELEGALNQLLAWCEMRGVPADTETAAGLLTNVSVTRPKHITPKQIVEKTANYFQLKPDEICSPARDKYIAVPRQLAMYLLRSELHLSFPKIANICGRKDHTTAIHSVNKIEKEIRLNMTIREQISDIRERLYV